MGTWLIFQGQPGVTDPESCQGLLDCSGDLGVPGNNPGIDRTPNRHRWTG